MHRTCYYETLTLNKPSNEQEIRAAYKKMATETHPKKNAEKPKEAAENFTHVGEAFNVLSDKEKKEKYDKAHSGELSPFNFEYNFKKAEESFRNFWNVGFFDDTPFFQDFKGEGLGEPVDWDVETSKSVVWE